MIQLIGGEMTQWSDLTGDHGPAPAGGPSYLPLLASALPLPTSGGPLSASGGPLPVSGGPLSVSGGPLSVSGGPPLASTLGRILVAGPHDPALIDALPAAQVTVLVRGVEDATALESRTGVTVCCGSLEKLGAAPTYDTVLALDGVERLCTPEAPDLSWDETLGHLLAVLRPGGRLLLGVENSFGLHRLLSLPPAPADTDWAEPDDRPTSPDAVRARLAAAGFPVVREYAAYPSALLGAEVLTDPSLRGYLEATVALPADPVPLADPARLFSGALRHGLAAALAPSWLLLAGALDAGPAAIIGPDPITRGPDGQWRRGDSAAASPSPSPASTVLPLGRTLADLILAASRRRALPDVRSLLTTWQAGPAAGVSATQVVVDADGVFHGLTPPGDPLVALRDLAAALIDGGHAHLWPSPADEAGLTALLAGMTGRELSPHDVPAAPRRASSVAELTVARDRLTQELADARAKHEFYERTIANRDAELKRLRQINALLGATAPGKAMLGGLKAGRRAVRAVVRRARG